MHKRAALTFCLCLLSGAALAADGAKFRAIGFSPDARYFAFEQYGVQDGSGFSYSDIFVLDINKDEWVKGTPLKTVLEDEAAKVGAVRDKSRQSATAILKSSNISVEAELLAATPFSEVVADRSKLTFHDHYNNAMGMFGNADDQGSWEIKVSNVAVPLPPDCEADIGVTGYQLALTNRKSAKSDVLHKDDKLPKSRFCAVGYDLEAVVQPVGGDEDGQMVAIVGLYSPGFEGADRRFIAVPFRLN